MRFITDYVEFSGNQGKSLLDYMDSVAIKDKLRVLDYLKNGVSDGVRCSCVFDYVKKEYCGETVRLFTDGEYYWDSEEIYHFEKYNIKLNDDFVLKVVKTLRYEQE